MRIFTQLGIIGLLTASLLLAGCASDQDRFKNMSEAKMYNGGIQALNTEDYEDAVEHFEAQEAKYPYGPYARQEQLTIIYAYYKNGDFPSAQSASERYIHLHPASQYVDYAYYMKAMATFAKERTFLENYFPVDSATRDMSPNIAAFQDFNQLVQQFPQSHYVADARLHMVYIRNAVARNNVKAGSYYYTRAAYVAALNRAQEVVLHYQKAPAVADALVLMVKCYRHLKLTDDAARALKTLQLNFPEKVRLVNQ
jgi:outer membrane protein assembly factor BamD